MLPAADRTTFAHSEPSAFDPKSDIECRSSRCITVRMPKLEFHEVDAARWGDFERLFESRGGPKSCWCMVWRAGAKTSKGVDRKFAIRRYVSTYRDLGGLNRAGELPEQVWSLACFFIRRDLRGQGLTKQIIEAAVQHAEKRGATVIEAYPVDPSSPSYRFMGYVQTFVSAGFYEVGRAGTRRHVLRRELRK